MNSLSYFEWQLTCWKYAQHERKHLELQRFFHVSRLHGSFFLYCIFPEHIHILFLRLSQIQTIQRQSPSWVTLHPEIFLFTYLSSRKSKHLCSLLVRLPSPIPRWRHTNSTHQQVHKHREQNKLGHYIILLKVIN